jgi:secreted PhoX family phosphatase
LHAKLVESHVSNPIDLSRRRALKLASGVALLPLAAGLAGCAGSQLHGRTTALKSVRFTSMAAPTLATPSAMADMTVGSSLEATFHDGSRQALALGYEAFFVTGDRVPDGAGGTVLAGGYFDIGGRPIVDTSVAGRERQYFSDCPDGSSLLTLANPAVPGIRGNAVFAVVQFEYATRDQGGAARYGQLPSPIAVLTLDQDPASGRLRLVKYHNVDTAPAHGLWITCGASLSPWNTHLASEEFEPDAMAIAANKRFESFGRFLYGASGKANPYHYGHLPEVTVHPDGSGTVIKHYCLGRISHELVEVMPDRRTVLMGDDFTNGGLFLFVADREADLSSGTLYVAKWVQTATAGPGAGTLSWVRLGSATSAEIRDFADRMRPEEIMDVRFKDPGLPGFTRIPYGGRHNWVRLRPGMEKAAAFLETHRYAALAGGSLGFNKMEGVTLNARDRVAYLAMSYIQASMLDGSGDIRVEGPKAGAVYVLDLARGQVDRSGEPIRSDWVPVSMAAPAALVGEDLKVPDALGNLAHPDRIANPDNVKFSEKLRTLFIGEDSAMHVNNFLWAYDVDTGELARVLSCPAGAEATGLHAVDEVNGWIYILTNFQHAGDWEKPLHDKVRTMLDPLVRANYKDRSGAAVGYITGVRLDAK